MWQLRGHDTLIRQIDGSLKEGRYAHSYLIVGPPQTGKRTLAINIAQAVNCLVPEDAPCGECNQCLRIANSQHADVMIIGLNQDEGQASNRTEIGINNVREVQRQANLKPYEGDQRVFIFDGAEYMSEEASNALLKTLEEPPPQVLIMLLTGQEDALLPTIRSRCRRLELRPLSVIQIAQDLVETQNLGQQEAQLLAHLSMGRLGWALSAARDPSIMEDRAEKLERISHISAASLEERFQYASDMASLFYKRRDEAKEVFYLWLRWWRDLLLIKEGASEFLYNSDWINVLEDRASKISTAQIASFIRAIQSAIDALEHNANARLALEVLMLSVPGEKIKA